MCFRHCVHYLACGVLAGCIVACESSRDLSTRARDLLVATTSSAPVRTAAEPARRSLSKQAVIENRYAYIPPQCFTQVADGPALRAQNPCYVCHAEASEPNFASQPELQLAYDFPQAFAGTSPRNAWRNVFRD